MKIEIRTFYKYYYVRKPLKNKHPLRCCFPNLTFADLLQLIFQLLSELVLMKIRRVDKWSRNLDSGSITHVLDFFFFFLFQRQKTLDTRQLWQRRRWNVFVVKMINPRQCTRNGEVKHNKFVHFFRRTFLFSHIFSSERSELRSVIVLQKRMWYGV